MQLLHYGLKDPPGMRNAPDVLRILQAVKELQMQVFLELQDKAKEELAKRIEVVYYEPGDLLWEQGTRCDVAYYVIDGEVGIYTTRQLTRATGEVLPPPDETEGAEGQRRGSAVGMAPPPPPGPERAAQGGRGTEETPPKKTVFGLPEDLDYVPWYDIVAQLQEKLQRRPDPKTLPGRERFVLFRVLDEAAANMIQQIQRLRGSAELLKAWELREHCDEALRVLPGRRQVLQQPNPKS